MFDWNFGVAMGEMFGSFILTFGIMITAIIYKMKTFDSLGVAGKRTLNILSLTAIVVLGVIVAKGFKGHGAINPGVQLMLSIFENSFKEFAVVVGFDFIGGILAFVATMLFVCSYNSSRKNKEKIIILKVFGFNEQSPRKNLGMESIANIFWYLPVLAIVAVDKTQTIHAGKFLVPLMVAFAVIATFSIIPEIGMANLNPQVWLGELLLKLVGSKGKINKKQLIGEFSGLLATLAVAAAIGGIGYGINEGLPTGNKIIK